MKTNSKTKTSLEKFNLEKFEVAKLKNLHLIKGGLFGNTGQTDTKTTDPVKTINEI